MSALPPGAGGAGFRLVRPEDRLAALAQLRELFAHARRDAIDVGNKLTAKPHGVVAAKLLLFGGIGMSQNRNCPGADCG